MRGEITRITAPHSNMCKILEEKNIEDMEVRDDKIAHRKKVEVKDRKKR